MVSSLLHLCVTQVCSFIFCHRYYLLILFFLDDLPPLAPVTDSDDMYSSVAADGSDSDMDCSDSDDEDEDEEEIVRRRKPSRPKVIVEEDDEE